MKNYIIDPASSHVIPLTLSVMATEGDVIELGCGFCSTPLLYSLLYPTGRKLFTIETKREWLDRILSQDPYYQHNFHIKTLVPDMVEAVKEIKGDCGVALIDCWDTESYNIRKKCAYVLREIADVLVIHDTEVDGFLEDKEWNDFAKDFRYKETFDRITPWTTVLSDKIDIH